MKIRRTCREVTELLLQGEERPLGALERLSLRLHWMVCAPCERFREQTALMRRAMGRWRGYRDEA